MTRAKLLVTAVTTVVAAATWGGTAAAQAYGGPVGASPVHASDVTGDRYIVRYLPGTDMSAAAQDLRAAGADVHDTVTRALDAAQVTLDATEARALAQAPGVVSVRVDRTMTVAGTQVEPTWGIDRVDQRIAAKPW